MLYCAHTGVLPHADLPFQSAAPASACTAKFSRRAQRLLANAVQTATVAPDVPTEENKRVVNNQRVREGDFEAELVERQVNKAQLLSEYLVPPFTNVIDCQLASHPIDTSSLSCQLLCI